MYTYKQHTENSTARRSQYFFYNFLIYTKVYKKINVKVNKKGEQLQMM